MLVTQERAVDRWDLQGAYFDGSLELLRKLAVTIDLDAALPRLSAIVSKMLPHDALRIACFDQRRQRVVNASTADVPDMTTSDGEEVIVDDLRTRGSGASAGPHSPERLGGVGYRSVLSLSTRAPEPLVHVAFWSKQPPAYTIRVEGVLFVNAGSVGKPKDGDSRACYVVMDTSGEVNVEFRRIPYDIDVEATAIRESSLPDEFAADLETGGVPQGAQSPAV